MGNSNKKPQDYEIVRTYRKENWIQYERLQNRQFWRNRINQEIAEVFRLYQIPSIDDLNRYEWRNVQNDLVRVYHIAMDPNNSLCTKNEYVQLLVEYIPIKLSQVNDLNQEEALTVLAATFRAFSLIEANFETVQPHEDLIGFNERGRPKIWINKDMSRNFPQKAYIVPYKNNKYQASSRVAKIVDMVEQRTCNGLLPPFLKDQIRQKNPDYHQALYILQQYAYYERLNLKSYLQAKTITSITNINRQDRQQKIFSEREQHLQKVMSNQHLMQNQIDLLKEGRCELKKQYSMGDFHSYTQPPSMTYLSQNKDNQNAYRDNIRSAKVSFMASSPNTHRSVPKVSFITNKKEPVQFLTDLPANKKSYISPDYFPNIQSNLIAFEQPRALITKKVSRQPSGMQPHFIFVHPVQQIITHQIVNGNSNFSQVGPCKAGLVQSPNQPIIQEKAKQKIIPNNKQLTSNEKGPQSPILPVGHSIIDNLAGEVSKSPALDQSNVIISANIEEEQFQASGTFNPITDKQVNAITQQQVYNEINQNKNFIKIDDATLSIEQLPINFESFAPNQPNCNQFVSFAPVETNIDTQQSIQEGENPPQTIESIQLEQQSKADQNTGKRSQQQKLLNHENSNIINKINPLKKENDKMSAQSSGEQRRVSIDEQSLNRFYDCPHPFYANYTPVESKFDVIVKRDSILSSDSNNRKERVSAFVHLEQDYIQRYIRDKYGSFINSDQQEYRGIKMSRVLSEYQKCSVKEHSNHDQINQNKQPVKEKPKKIVAKILNLKAKPNVSNITENTEEDFLDVNYLQKSLDKRYCGRQKKTGQQQNYKQEDDQLNIARLEEGLLKFSKNKFEPANSLKDEQIQIQKKQTQNTVKLQQKNKVCQTRDKKKYGHKQVSSTGGANYQSIDSKEGGQPHIAKPAHKKTVRIDPAVQDEHKVNFSQNMSHRQGETDILVSAKSNSNNLTNKREYKNEYYSQNAEPISKFSSKSPRHNDNNKIQKGTFEKIERKYNQYVKTARSKRSEDENIYLAKIGQLNHFENNQRAQCKVNHIASVKSGRYSELRSNRGMGDKKISYDELRSLLWN